MKIGYARVSTEQQNLDLQIAALKAAGCERIFEDKAGGVSGKQYQLKKCLETLTRLDTLIIYKLDRLGRSLKEILLFAEELDKKGVSFVSLSENIDTTNPIGRAMFQMIGILAELERSSIVERTRAGREAAKVRGVVMGRKAKLSTLQIEHAKKLLASGEHINIVAKSLQVSRETLYRAIKKPA